MADEVKLKPTPINPIEIKGAIAFSAEHARIWAEGTDSEVEKLGGEHSAKGWADSSEQASHEYTDEQIALAKQELTDSMNIAVSGAVNTAKSYTDNEVSAETFARQQAVSGEAETRALADNNLQSQIDALSASSDVKDIVGTYTELQAYDTSTLGDNDIIKVLDDSTHGDAPSYYRWDATGQQFEYIGSESASYTKAESDAKFLTQTAASSTYLTQTSASSTYATKTELSGKQDELVSGTNIKTINSTSILGSGNIDIDSLPSQTGASGKFLTTNGTTASWDNIPSEIPSQTGNSGKFLTTNGSTASWATVPSGGDTLPDQTGQEGKFLTTDGSSASWATVQKGDTPTLTWFTGNTGKTLNTGLDLSNANLVKVYKNGLLLQDSSDNPVERYYTAPADASQQLKIYPNGQQNVPFSTTYSSWELDFRFEWGPGASIASLVGSPNTSSSYPFMLAVYGGILSVWLHDGNSWLLEHSSLGWAPAVGSIYDYKIKFTGSAYEFYHKVATDINYTTDLVFNSSTKVQDGTDGIWFFNVYLGFDLYSKSKLYMNNVKFIADNATLFDGETASKGTDFAVTSGWTEEIVGGDADYFLSSPDISFTTDLESTDKVAVEVF